VPLLGDVIRYEANATRVMKPWGNVLAEITREAALLDNMTIMNQEGRVLLQQPLVTGYEGHPTLTAKRGQVQRSILDYAISLGVEVTLGAPVAEVLESDFSAGVRVGKKWFEADCVIAGDGVRSKARAFVTGMADRPKMSGYAIYRTWFPLDVLRGDSVVEDLAMSERPICKVWIASDAHAVLTTNPNMRGGTFFLTHKAS
jgi:2-polyprenyl-6-methoxyphenol hydroxylase-like FAD-dependent oxidoreductase